MIHMKNVTWVSMLVWNSFHVKICSAGFDVQWKPLNTSTSGPADLDVISGWL